MTIFPSNRLTFATFMSASFAISAGIVVPLYIFERWRDATGERRKFLEKYPAVLWILGTVMVIGAAIAGSPDGVVRMHLYGSR